MSDRAISRFGLLTETARSGISARLPRSLGAAVCRPPSAGEAAGETAPPPPSRIASEMNSPAIVGFMNVEPPATCDFNTIPGARAASVELLHLTRFDGDAPGVV